MVEILIATAALTRYIAYKLGPKHAFVNFEIGLNVGIMVESFGFLLLVQKEKWRALRRKVAQRLPEWKRIESVLPQSIQSYLVRRRTQKLVAAIGPIEGTSRPAKIHARCGRHPSYIISGFAKETTVTHPGPPHRSGKSNRSFRQRASPSSEATPDSSGADTRNRTPAGRRSTGVGERRDWETHEQVFSSRDWRAGYRDCRPHDGVNYPGGIVVPFNRPTWA